MLNFYAFLKIFIFSSNSPCPKNPWMLWICLLWGTAGTDIHDNDQLSQLNEKRKSSEWESGVARISCDKMRITKRVWVLEYDGSQHERRSSDRESPFVYTHRPLPSLSVTCWERRPTSQFSIELEIFFIARTEVCLGPAACWSKLNNAENILMVPTSSYLHWKPSTLTSYGSKVTLTGLVESEFYFWKFTALSYLSYWCHWLNC